MSDIPPHDLASERAVLGAVLLSDRPLKKLIVDVGLTGAAFYRELHGHVWDAMVALAMKGDPVDALTVRAHLEAKGHPREKLKLLLDEVTGEVPMASNAVGYARRVIELAEWRQVQKAAYELRAAAETHDRDARHVAEGMLASARRHSGDTRSPETLAEDVWRHLEGHQVPAWSTPWPTLNSAMGGGLRSGEVTLLGGWTSMGKSLAIDQILRRCREQGANVHLYINEMAPTMRALRIVSAMTGVPQKVLAQPKQMTDHHRDRVTKAIAKGLPFGITQVTDWSAEEVARDIRFRDWDVCALDLLHRLPYREERDLAEISSMLNAAAQASETHLVAAVHLNELRATGAALPPPVLRDIRASGMLKNDADNVMFVHREEEEMPGGAMQKTDDASLYLAKCRNGSLAGVALHLDAPRGRFLEAADPDRFGYVAGRDG